MPLHLRRMHRTNIAAPRNCQPRTSLRARSSTVSLCCLWMPMDWKTWPCWSARRIRLQAGTHGKTGRGLSSNQGKSYDANGNDISTGCWFATNEPCSSTNLYTGQSTQEPLRFLSTGSILSRRNGPDATFFDDQGSVGFVLEKQRKQSSRG